MHNFRAAEFFRKASHEEREHAEKLAKYQNKRGGCIRFTKILKSDFEKRECLHTTTKKFDLYEGFCLKCISERWKINKILIQTRSNLYKIAEKNNNTVLCDFIQCEYLQVQKDTIKQFADYLTKTITVGNRLGEYLFDKMTLNRENSIILNFSHSLLYFSSL
ncbi:Ferritin-2 heavy chain [Schistosoma japonicum]|nr:Ferritin-2 heavy chain [Schistosoma japonicum]